MIYPKTIQISQLMIRNTHSIKRILSSTRFDLTEKQIKNMRNYNFVEFDRNSTVVKIYPHLKNKIREGYRYYKNEHLNMMLCVKNGYLITVLKVDGTDYSDYNNRKGWGDSVFS